MLRSLNEVGNSCAQVSVQLQRRSTRTCAVSAGYAGSANDSAFLDGGVFVIWAYQCMFNVGYLCPR